jgi:hypothetical protein
MTLREHWEYTKQHPIRFLVFLSIGGYIGHLAAVWL